MPSASSCLHSNHAPPASRRTVHVSPTASAAVGANVGDGENRQEIIILGAGIAGVSTAHYVLQQSSNVSVRLIDSLKGVAEGTSRKNGGLLCPSLSSSWTTYPLLFGKDAMIPAGIKNALTPKKKQEGSASLIRFDPKLLLDRRLWNFALHWLRRRPHLQSQHEHIGAIMSYSMECFDDPDDDIMQGLRYSRTAMGTRSRSSEVATTDSSGDIASFCNGLYDELVRRRGDRISFHPRTTVEGFELKDGEIESVKVRDENNNVTTLRADKYVVALGNQSYDICRMVGIQCPVFPVLGCIITFLSDVIVPYNLELSNRAFVAPFGNNTYHLSGFAEFVSKYNCADAFDVDPARAEVLIEVAREIFPDLKVIDMTVGYRPLSPDDTPLIGQTKIRNLYLNTGGGSKGWTMGPGSGKLLAALLLDMPPEVDPIEYSPMRFETKIF